MCKNNYAAYFKGISLFTLSLISSAFNDVISKYLSSKLGAMEVMFLRFLFSTLTIFPFIIYYGLSTIKTSYIFLQLTRGILLFIGMSSWIYGLNFVHVTTATAVSFAMPLFVLILAVFFLNEKITLLHWLATIIGFIVVIAILRPDRTNYEVVIFVFSSLSFAALDIINKKFIIQESIICVLFYSALITTILALPFALSNWKSPELSQFALLFILGCSSNLILFFLLKALLLVDATTLAPYRYFEIVISAFLAYVVFKEIPDINILYFLLLLISLLFFNYLKPSKKKSSI